MKVGDAVELVDDEGGVIAGTVAQIVVQIEDEEGELWEIPVDVAKVPELEGGATGQTEE